MRAKDQSMQKISVRAKTAMRRYRSNVKKGLIRDESARAKDTERKGIQRACEKTKNKPISKLQKKARRTDWLNRSSVHLRNTKWMLKERENLTVNLRKSPIKPKKRY